MGEKQQAMEAAIRNANETPTNMTTTLAAEFSRKLVAQITQKQPDMKGMQQAIEAVLARSDEALRQQGTQWKTHTDAAIEQLRTQTTLEVRSFQSPNSGFEGRLSTLAELVQSGANFMGRQNGGNDCMAGGTFSNIFRKGLLDQRDFRMPQFPEKPKDNEQFKRWLKDFGRYFSRMPSYPEAEIAFGSITG